MDDYRALLDSIRDSDSRFAFDRDGRPDAITAVRNALPALERDLFDAIIEDYACELAAAEEAWRRAVCSLKESPPGR
jgi:hypothetical protein